MLGTSDALKIGYLMHLESDKHCGTEPHDAMPAPLIVAASMFTERCNGTF